MGRRLELYRTQSPKNSSRDGPMRRNRCIVLTHIVSFGRIGRDVLAGKEMADTLLDRIGEFISRHRMFRDGDRAGVAVSGGADSVFLLHALRELAPRWNLTLSVIHIDHGIRGAASTADAEFVAQLARTFGLPIHLHRADVPAIAGNLEEAARNVSQAFYAGLIA